jgi:hypothetical protein
MQSKGLRLKEGKPAGGGNKGAVATLFRMICALLRSLYNQLMAEKEFITHEPPNKEAWICVCGNRPDSHGFYPCDKDGNEMEPTKEWPDLYVCDSCGRIIIQETLEVVGRNPGHKRLA